MAKALGMKSPRTLAAIAALLLPLAALAASPIDGSWKGSFKAPDGSGEMSLTFTFKADGDKVTGSVEGDNGPVPIVSGSIKGSSFEFKVDLNGTTIEHNCTVSGDTIDMTFTFGDQPPAKMKLGRVVAAQAAGPDPSGLWKWTISPAGAGQTFDISAKLSYADGKLTGTYQSRMGEAPITDASFKDGAIAFSVVRERDGNSFTVKYKGTLAGDSITGTVELPGFGGGDSATVDWKASRSRQSP
jgi:type 1 fimbria pilin